MTLPEIRCPQCAGLIEVQTAGSTGFSPCPSCATPLRLDVFPAYFTNTGATAPESVSGETQSGCFFHPRKKAVRACDHCGRFVCSLCDIELGKEHICPSCFEAGSRKKKLRSLENYRPLHDDIALALAVIPVILIWPTLLTAPAALFYALRHWKSPSSIIPRRSKLRYILAIALSGVQICIWVVVIGAFLRR